MHSIRLLLAAVLVSIAVPAAPARAAVAPALVAPSDVYSYLEDPERVAEGQEGPHAELRPYLDASAAAVGAQDTPWTASLDGPWKIAMADRPENVPSGFQADGYDTSSWRTVTVPHTWQTDGLDHPMFRNTVTDMYPDDPRRCRTISTPLGHTYGPSTCRPAGRRAGRCCASRG